MRPTPRYSTELQSVADYLADREGLTGTTRTAFLQLLRETFGFRATAPYRVAPLLGLAALGFASWGVVLELREGFGITATWPWLATAIVGAALAFEIARHRRRSTFTNREFEWRAYCLLIRPMILRSRPGLLDRNLTADRGATEHVRPSYGGALTSLLREPSIGFWIPAGIGWCLGCAAALVARASTGPKPWYVFLPLGGALIGPAVWAFFRYVVFRRLHRSARETR